MTTHRASHDIIVILVNYNRKEFLPDCLDGLRAQEAIKFETVMVDNGSTDGSLELIEEQYPEVRIIRAGENLGFAGGNNRGMAWGLEHGAKICVLLNDDTIPDPRWLVEGVTTLRSDPAIGIVQSKILLYDTEKQRKTAIVNSAGNQLHYLGFAYAGNYLAKDRGQFDADQPIHYASGATFFVKAEVLRNVGLFAPHYFMYHEDLDLSWRARLGGWQIWRSGQSVVWHKYHFSRNLRKFYFMERNRWLTLLKTYRIRTLLVLLPFALLTEAGLLLASLRQGWFGHKVRSFFGVLRWLPQTLRERRTIQAQRTISDRVFLAGTTDEVVFEDYSAGIMQQIFHRLSRLYRRILEKVAA